MSAHLELEPNQQPDVKRKIVLVGDGELLACVFVRRGADLSSQGGCGKTTLLMTYAHNRLPEVRFLDYRALICVAAAGSFAIRTHSPIFSPSQVYIPTVFDYVTNRRFDGKIVRIAFWDTASQEECDRLRPLSYQECHAILIVFAVDSPESFENIQEKVRIPFSTPASPFYVQDSCLMQKWDVSLFLLVMGLPGDKSGG